ncbi:MAG: hypothetical protein IT289_09345 [Oligoflexia bacterium]|nr:hypothetical protein [Oligoflexia bacterium]
MKVFLNIILVMVFSSIANAKLTTIDGADITCQKPGAMIFINSTDERVWQGDVGDVEAAELEDVEFSRMRCPGCVAFSGVINFEIEGLGSAGQLAIKGETRGPRNGLTLNYSVRVGPEEESFTFDCQIGSSR